MSESTLADENVRGAATNPPEDWPRSVEAWRCSDGRVFSGWLAREDAERWERAIEGARLATEHLASGGTLGDARRIFYIHRDGDDLGAAILSVLDRTPALIGLTRSSRLVIEHWQCIRRPIYAVNHVTPTGDVYVGGTEPGGLGTYYGNAVGWADLARYVAETVRRCGAVPTASAEARS